MFTDERRDKVLSEVRQVDLRSFSKQLTPEVFAEAARESGVKIGCNPLNVVNLVWLGIASAIDHAASFAYVLTATLTLLQDEEGYGRSRLCKQIKAAGSAKGKKGKKGNKSKHDPRCDDPAQISEEAFTQARQRMPLKFWVALVMILARRFQEEHSEQLNYRDYRLLAMDGTVLTLADEAALREHYGVPKNGKKKNKACPQARMLMLTLPGVRIPIAYNVAPIAVSELTMATGLLPHLRANDLLLMDRGFVSYGLFWQIQNCGAYFGTRLKKNIKYKVVRQLGPKDCLIEWTPRDSRGKWRELPRSIQLRMIRYQYPGFRPSAIITNELDPKRLPREDWVRLAQDSEDKGEFRPGLYHRRWEIETTFRELKVVLKTNSLRSHTPASVEYELAGRVVYYLLLRWLIVLAAEKHGLDPLRISFTNALRKLKQMRKSLVTNGPRWARETLLPRLLNRIASHLVPLRPGRHYPRPNDTKPKRGSRGDIQLPAKLSNRINTKHKNTLRKPCRQA